jgi:NCS1 family nucleobase:cation symporter-1
MAGLIAFLVPVGLTIAAIMIGKGSWLHGFYTYGWFTGSILGGLIYYFVANNETGSSK